MRLATIALTAVLMGCTTYGLQVAPGESSVEGGVYRNQTHGVEIHFKEPAGGWSFLLTPLQIAQCGQPYAILCGANAPHLIHFFLTVEDGGFAMSNEDYQLALEAAVREQAEIEDSALQDLRANNVAVLVWRYLSDGDVVVQAFFARGTENFRLVFIVPEHAYPRRREQIVGIIRSLELRSGAAQALARSL